MSSLLVPRLTSLSNVQIFLNFCINLLWNFVQLHIFGCPVCGRWKRLIGAGCAICAKMTALRGVAKIQQPNNGKKIRKYKNWLIIFIWYQNHNKRFIWSPELARHASTRHVMLKNSFLSIFWLFQLLPWWIVWDQQERLNSNWICDL